MQHGAAGKAAAAAATASSSKGAAAAAGEAAAADDAAAAAPLVQTGALTLRLRGGADVPQRVACNGELPGGVLRPREKEVSLGPAPVGEHQVAIVTLRNAGTGEAAFRVGPTRSLCAWFCDAPLRLPRPPWCAQAAPLPAAAPSRPPSAPPQQAPPNPALAVSPDRASVAPGGSAEVEVSFVVGSAGAWAATLELEVRGGRPIRIPIK